ncbi:MAG: CerR family C-terminal domain-containing protein [Phycisphaerales bacterium]
MPDTIDTTSGATTRQRLIEAAGELFAELGFRDVTVRQICLRAGANIAAVNYHFRDKESLYREVVLSAYKAARERFPINAGVTDRDLPEARLKAFIRGILHRIFDETSPPWGKLLAREMIDPSPALDGIVEQGARPQYQILTGIVREVLGPTAPEDKVRRYAASAVGQALIYHTCRSMMQRMFGSTTDGPEQIDALAEHITRYSMDAMKAARGGSGGGGAGNA